MQLVLLLGSALGLSINHSTFVCTRVNEPLMTSVAGAAVGQGLRLGGHFPSGLVAKRPARGAPATGVVPV